MDSEFLEKLSLETFKMQKIIEDFSKNLKKRPRPTDELFEKILVCDSEHTYCRVYSESPYYDSFDRNEFSFNGFKVISEDEFYENQRKYKCFVVIV